MSDAPDKLWASPVRGTSWEGGCVLEAGTQQAFKGETEYIRKDIYDEVVSQRDTARIAMSWKGEICT